MIFLAQGNTVINKQSQNKVTGKMFIICALNTGFIKTALTIHYNESQSLKFHYIIENKIIYMWIYSNLLLKCTNHDTTLVLFSTICIQCWRVILRTIGFSTFLCYSQQCAELDSAQNYRNDYANHFKQFKCKKLRSYENCLQVDHSKKSHALQGEDSK